MANLIGNLISGVIMALGGFGLGWAVRNASAEKVRKEKK